MVAARRRARVGRPPAPPRTAPAPVAHPGSGLPAGAGWPLAVKPRNTEERNMRLMGRVWSKAARSDIDAAANEVLAQQRPGVGPWAKSTAFSHSRFPMRCGGRAGEHLAAPGISTGGYAASHTSGDALVTLISGTPRDRWKLRYADDHSPACGIPARHLTRLCHTDRVFTRWGAALHCLRPRLPHRGWNARSGRRIGPPNI